MSATAPSVYLMSLDDDGAILDGRNRWRAASEAGVTPTTIEWTGGDPWTFVWRENAVRRHLEAGQKAALHLAFVEGSEAWQQERAARAEAANRARSEAAKEQPRTPDGARLAGDGSREPSPARRGDPVRERLASAAGVSAATMQRAIELRAKAPEKFEAVKRGEVPLAKALGEVKLEAKRALAETIRANPIVTPDGRYQVIVADPPWKYDARAPASGRRSESSLARCAFAA